METRNKETIRTVAEEYDYALQPDTPALLPIGSLAEMYRWYCLSLCEQEIIDPRGPRVTFLGTDFVHLIKLLDKFRKEPKNSRMTVEQIESGRITLVPGRIDLTRAGADLGAFHYREPNQDRSELAKHGPRNPGDAYIKNFGVDRPVYRVLLAQPESQYLAKAIEQER